MGCIQSGAPINIVRLTYRDSVATARLLTSQELLPLMRTVTSIDKLPEWVIL